MLRLCVIVLRIVRRRIPEAGKIIKALEIELLPEMDVSNPILAVDMLSSQFACLRKVFDAQWWQRE